MTSRQARTERRAAERKAKKAEIKRQKAAARLGIPELTLEADEAAHLSEPKTKKEFSPELVAEANAARERIHRAAGLAPIPPIGFVSQHMPQPPSAPDEAAHLSEPKTEQLTARTLANRANAQHSTGPTTPAGKLASSRNSLQHGLASGQVIMPGEDPSHFEALLNDLVAEHQPATTTEQLLIQEMAQSFWLAQRALRLQNDCFTESGVDEKRLALFLRYQTTHERVFHKALTALLKLQKQRARDSKSGFVSQSAARSAPDSGFVSHNAPEAQHFGTPSGGAGCPLGPAEGHSDQFVRQNRHSEAA